jgi:pyruvate-formate lyase-activating enzyme
MTTWYCVAPFRQVYIDNTGVSACCRLPKTQTTLTEWSSNSELHALQQQFLSGQQPTQCQSCVEDENAFGESLRTQNNRDYDNKIYVDTAINFVDYRASNICNFKCRSCFPTFSHGIAHEVVRTPALQKFYAIGKNKIESVDTENFKWVIENLDQIDRLMFTGGEPTVMPEVKLMLEEVIKKASDRIGVLITTNGSFTDDFWYNLPKRINNLHWTLSLDSVGSYAEVVRHGTDWDIVKHNSQWLSKNAASLMINSVVSNLSIFQLYPLLKFVKNLVESSNGINGCDHRLQYCLNPTHLDACNLNEKLLVDAVEYIQQCQTLSLLGSQQDFLLGLLGKLKESTYKSERWEKFQEINSILDTIRGEDYSTLLVPVYDINI